MGVSRRGGQCDRGDLWAVVLLGRDAGGEGAEIQGDGVVPRAGRRGEDLGAGVRDVSGRNAAAVRGAVHLHGESEHVDGELDGVHAVKDARCVGDEGDALRVLSAGCVLVRQCEDRAGGRAGDGAGEEVGGSENGYSSVKD